MVNTQSICGDTFEFLFNYTNNHVYSNFMDFIGDNSKIKKATDWKPEYTLEAGLSEVLDEVVK